MSDHGLPDSGARMTGPGGMLKEVTDKPDPTLLHIPFLRRFAAHMTKGAKKYNRNNWKQASTIEELWGFQASAQRHLWQWIESEDDEDHAAAVCANIMMAEYLKSKLIGDLEL